MRCFIMCVVLLLSIVITSSCSNTYLSDAIDNSVEESSQYTKQSSIRYISELEIINKSAKYLKTYGEFIAYNETEMNLFESDNDEIILYDENEGSITYTGEYLEVIFYTLIKGEGDDVLIPNYTLYFDHSGNILGYTKSSGE